MLKDLSLVVSVSILLILSIFVLKSVASALFPLYFVYVAFGVLAYIIFSNIDFDVISVFSKQLYIFSIVLLLLTIIIGQVTRGTIRWIPIGPISLQPAELVRPFLLVFFANYLTGRSLDRNRAIKAMLLLILPAFLILIQPSLSVSVLTFIGFIGVLLASNFNKKYILLGLALAVVMVPVFWQIMAPYQRQRVLTFFEPGIDPLGAGYNSLQSKIAVGAGELTGRGLGRGIQTQLSFLPEKQSDFIFAAVGEELGFIGAGLMLVTTFVILMRLIKFLENSVSPAGRAYICGFLLIYLAQVFVHVGMNMGMLPVTGLPFPLVSAGGSSLLATMAGLGIAVGAYKR